MTPRVYLISHTGSWQVAKARKTPPIGSRALGYNPVTVYDLTRLFLIVFALATDRVVVSSRYARGRALGAPREEDHLRKEATIKNFGNFFSMISSYMLCFHLNPSSRFGE